MNLDGTAHECRDKQQTQQQQQPKQQQKKQLTLEDLDYRLQKLESKFTEVFGSH